MNLMLQDIKQKKIIFGGIQKLLVGDWLQLPPTGGNTLFSTPNIYNCSNRTFCARMAGKIVWDAINYVRKISCSKY
jgi:hypothetical protein